MTTVKYITSTGLHDEKPVFQEKQMKKKNTTHEKPNKGTRYSKRVQEKVIKEYLRGGSTMKALTKKYNLGGNALYRWLKRKKEGLEEKQDGKTTGVSALKAAVSTSNAKDDIARYMHELIQIAKSYDSLSERMMSTVNLLEEKVSGTVYEKEDYLIWYRYFQQQLDGLVTSIGEIKGGKNKREN